MPAAQTGAIQKCKIICEEAKSDCVIPAHTVKKTSFHPLHLCKCGHRLFFVCTAAECSKIGLYVWYKGPCVFSYTLLPLDVHCGIYRGNVSSHRYSEKLKKKSLWKILDRQDLKAAVGQMEISLTQAVTQSNVQKVRLRDAQRNGTVMLKHAFCQTTEGGLNKKKSQAFSINMSIYWDRKMAYVIEDVIDILKKKRNNNWCDVQYWWCMNKYLYSKPLRKNKVVIHMSELTHWKPSNK